MRTGKWPAVAFRAFGIGNLVFVAIGLWAMSYPVRAATTGRMGNSPEQPYFLQAFWTMSAINMVFLILLGFTGFQLLRLRRSAVRICNVLFVAEILYSFFIPWGAEIPRAVSNSIAAATGVGNMGTAVNLFTGYPIIALLGLNLSRWRLRNSINSLPPAIEPGSSRLTPG